MKNLILPKTCKMKTIKRGTDIYFQGDIVATNHFMISRSFLDSIKCKGLGFTRFKNKINKELCKTIELALKGERPRFLKSILSIFNTSLEGYIEAPRESIQFYTGLDKYEKSMDLLGFNIEGAPILDIEYAPLLFFNIETKIYFRGELEPIILKLNGETAAVCIGMRKESFKTIELMKGNN